MRNCVLAAAAVAVVVPLSPAVARQAQGFTVRSTELLSGPERDYPPLRRLRADTGITVYGCLNDWSWCDVSYGYDRGWVERDDIVINYRGHRSRILPSMGIGILSFIFASYWDDHYRNRSFYSQRPRWEQQYSSNYRPQWGPRGPAPSVTVQQRQPVLGGRPAMTQPMRQPRLAVPARQAAPVPWVAPQPQQPRVMQRQAVPVQPRAMQRQAVPVQPHAAPMMRAAPVRQNGPGNGNANANRARSVAPVQQRGGKPGQDQGQGKKDHKPKD